MTTNDSLWKATYRLSIKNKFCLKPDWKTLSTICCSFLMPFWGITNSNLQTITQMMLEAQHFHHTRPLLFRLIQHFNVYNRDIQGLNGMQDLSWNKRKDIFDDNMHYCDTSSRLHVQFINASNNDIKLP